MLVERRMRSGLNFETAGTDSKVIFAEYEIFRARQSMVVCVLLTHFWMESRKLN